MPTFPAPCPTCKGSLKLLQLNPDFDSLPGLPSVARMMPGVAWVSPRPLCPDCDGNGTLEKLEPIGEYPPPPQDRKSVVELSVDQSAAIDEILVWFHETVEKRKSLAGFAGTGKTTIIAELLGRLQQEYIIKICAPTGKAASVLRAKGVHATTLHKLVYAPETICSDCNKIVMPIKEDGKKAICPECETPTIKTRWERVPIIDADLVIVDEASMLNTSMVNDIEELAQKILYVGDHGQLEPIGEDPMIMREPDIRLEQIHRQAAHSGIIQVAHHMRVGHSPSSWEGDAYTDARVARITKLIPRMLSRFDIVLCGYNKTRKDINSAIRKFRGFDDPLPEVGERLICLQNDSDLGIFNGLLVTVTKRRKSYEYPRYDFVDDAGTPYIDVRINPEQFAAEKKLEYANKGIGLFDFGYCLTVHKSQGSAWDSVAVVEHLASAWDPARWRYTAATRAAKRLEYWIPLNRM